MSRYGSAAILTLDGGEGRRYNDSFIFSGHQMMTVDKQEGVYAGGKGTFNFVCLFGELIVSQAFQEIINIVISFYYYF